MKLLWFFEYLQMSFFPSLCLWFLIQLMGLVVITGFWSHLEIYWWIMIIAHYYLGGFPFASKTLPLKRYMGCHGWPSCYSYTVHPTAVQAKDKVIGSTVSIFQDLSLLWPQISDSSYRNPKFIGITYWAGFSGVKVLGQGPVVCMGIITRCTCSAPQGLLAGHEQRCLCSPNPLLWQAWIKASRAALGPSRKATWAMTEGHPKEPQSEMIQFLPFSQVKSMERAQHCWRDLLFGAQNPAIGSQHTAFGTMSYHSTKWYLPWYQKVTYVTKTIWKELQAFIEKTRVKASLHTHASTWSHFTQTLQSDSQPRQVYRNNGQLLSIACSPS